MLFFQHQHALYCESINTMHKHRKSRTTTLFVTGRGVMPSDGAVKFSQPDQVRGFWGDMVLLSRYCELHNHIHLTLNFALPSEAFPLPRLIRMHGSICGAGDECVVPRTNTGRDLEKVMAQIKALLPQSKGITDIDDVVFIGVGLTRVNGVGVQALLRKVMASISPPIHLTNSARSPHHGQSWKRSCMLWCTRCRSWTTTFG